MSPEVVAYSEADLARAGNLQVISENRRINPITSFENGDSLYMCALKTLKLKHDDVGNRPLTSGEWNDYIGATLHGRDGTPMFDFSDKRPVIRGAPFNVQIWADKRTIIYSGNNGGIGRTIERSIGSLGDDYGYIFEKTKRVTTAPLLR